MRIVIIGAGVAGCIMAQQLSQLDEVEVICLEKASVEGQAHFGTGVAIGPNAVRALQWRDPNLLSRIDEASLAWKTWRNSLTDGTVLFNLALSEVADSGGWRISWSELNRVLRDAAGSRVTYDCTIDGVHRDKRNAGKTVVEWTQSGERRSIDDIDLLIAGDGRYSLVREIFSGPPQIRHLGVAISRAVVADDSGGLIDDYEQWFNGPHRLLAYKMRPSQIYLCGTFPIAPGTVIPDSLKSAPALRERFTPESGKLSDQCAWLVNTLCREADTSHWSRMQEHEVLYADPISNVLYLGDAAHAMVPTLAQGATQAIEDACFAADYIIRSMSLGDRSPRDWLNAITDARTERARFVLDFSMDASDTMLEGCDPVKDTVVRMKPEFLSKLDRLYRGGPGPNR